MAFFNRPREVRTVVIKQRRLNAALIAKVVALGVLLLVGFYGVRITTLHGFANQSKAQIYTQLEEARQALRNLDPDGAREPLGAIDEEVRLVQSEATKYGVLTLSRGWGLIQEKFAHVTATLQSLAGISSTAIHLNDDIAFLKQNAAHLMLDKQGDILLTRLRDFRTKLRTLASYIDEINSAQAGLDEPTMRALADLRAEIDRNSQALDAIAEILGSPSPRHLLVIFQNQSELRPAGGFIGSYAHIELQAGNINNIEIRDIYDPDGQLDQKIIPPENLQTITKEWEARDANWFFDFPTSARKVMAFLNNSKIYQEREVTFTDVIAINTNVLKDIIGLVGSLEVPEYDVTITPENFLAEIQAEVEAGEDKKVNQPKRILKVLAPMILDHLSTLDEAGKQQLAAVLRQRIENRDIIVYIGHPALQQYLRTQGITGDVLPANNNTINEYLAVVNTNLGGGKTDAVMDQAIHFESIITQTGEIHNQLKVNRTHHGKKTDEWWYRSTNRNLLTVYTPLGTQLLSAAGRSRWPTLPTYNYKGYASDPDVAAINETRRYLTGVGIDRAIVNEKTVFESWVNTPIATSTEYLLTYKNPRLMPIGGSIPYEFIFEKQSGASTSLSISISAPPQYKWKEINSGVIEYSTDAPPGRIRIRQTLVPLQ